MFHRRLPKKVYNMLAALPSTQFGLNEVTYERIDGFKTGLHGLVHGLSGDDAGGLEFNSLSHVGLDGSLTVDGVTESVNDSAEHALSDGDIHDGTGSLDDITLLDLSILKFKVIHNCQTTNMVRFFFQKPGRGTYLSLPRTTIPTLSVSKLRAIPLIPEENSTISPAWTLVRPKTLAIPSPMEITVPNSFKSFYNY